MSRRVLSIIIPVYKEEHIINNLLEQIPLSDEYFNYEIFVVDGEKDFNTLKSIRHNHVTKLRSSAGRAIQMNRGAEAASGDILLFLHADSILPANGFKRISEFYQNRKYYAGAFNLKIGATGFGYRLTEFMACKRSRLSRIPFGDQAIFIRSEYFKELNGYKEIPLMEEIELMKRIRNQKKKIIIYKERVITSSRKWEKEGILYTTLRNWCLQFLFFLGVSAESLVGFYYKHMKRANGQAD